MKFFYIYRVFFGHMKTHSIKKRFQIGVFCILLPFCATGSILIYYYLKDLVTAGIYRETEIFISTADATRTYVKDVLRPKMVELIPADSIFPPCHVNHIRWSGNHG